MKKLYFWLYFKYLEFLVWLDGKQIKSNYVGQETTQIIINAQKLKYQEGISRIKDTINSLVKTKNTDEYKTILKEIKELVNLASDSDPAKLKTIEALNKAWVYSGSDIKSIKDKAQMVENRIQHYKQLQEHKKHREMLRQIRKIKNGT